MAKDVATWCCNFLQATKQKDNETVEANKNNKDKYNFECADEISLVANLQSES